MKVIVVERHERYEGSEILGIYATVETVQRAHHGQWRELRGRELAGGATRAWGIVTEKPSSIAITATEYEVQE